MVRDISRLQPVYLVLKILIIPELVTVSRLFGAKAMNTFILICMYAYVYTHTHTHTICVYMYIYTHMYVHTTYMHIICIRINTLDFILPFQI